MARKNQFLINYHTSGLTSMPLASEVELGEIVVRHNDEKPEVLFKTNNGDFAVLPSSGTIASAINEAVTEVQGNVDAVGAKVDTLSGATVALESHIAETYATSADTESAIAKAKDEAIASASAYTDAQDAVVYTSATTFATSAVEAAKTELQGAIDDVESKVQEANSGTSVLETYIKENYATSADTESAISKAKDEAIASASAYTDAQDAVVYTSATTFATSAVEAAKTELQGNIDDVDAKVDTLSGATVALESHVAETYATSADTESAISKAKGEAIASASAYTDAQDAVVYTSATTFATSAVEAAKTELNGSIDEIRSGMESGFTSMRSDLSATTEDLTNLINNKVSVAYRYQGSCTYAELASKTQQEVGYVWNVTDANGNFPAGTNYAWNGSEWDALGGSVDLTPYLGISAFTEYQTEVTSKFDEISANIEDANSGTSVLEAYVKENYATSADTESAIAKAKGEAIASASAYTDAQDAVVYTSATTFATSAVEAAKTELQGNIDDVDAKVGTLSGATVALESHIAETYATSADTESAISKAKDEAIASASAYTDAQDAVVYTSATTFATSAVEAAKTELNSSIDDVRSELGTAIESAISALTVEVEANELTTAAAFNKFNESAGFNENGESVLDGGKSLTQGILDAESHIAEVYTSATTFTTSAVEVAKTELQGAIDDVTALVSDNEEAIKDVKAVADTAVQSFSANCGVVASNVETVGTFDFSSLIIDCGEF